MALISLRSRSHVNASMVLTDHLFIHNYIRLLLNIILRSNLIVRMGLEPMSYCLCVRRLSQLSHTGRNLYTNDYICIDNNAHTDVLTCIRRKRFYRKSATVKT